MDSTAWLDTLSASDSAKEITANENFDAASPATLFGRHASACSALTWAYYGGRHWNGTNVVLLSNGTLSLTNNATNYIEATTAGVVSANTSGFTAGRIRIAKVVTASGAVSSHEDHRAFGQASVPSSGVTSVNITAPAAGITASGGPITSSGAITLALANDLSALEGLSGTGFAKRTGTDAWSVGALGYSDLPTGMIGKPRVDAHTYASSVTLDASTYDCFEVTLTGNITVDFTGGTDGQRILVRLTQDGTGSRIVTWGTSVAFGSDITSSSVTASTGANKIDYFGLIYSAASSKYHMVSFARGY